MALPLIPHSEIEPECCGCLCEIVEDKTYFVCNECSAVVSVEQVQRIVMQMESTEATCPSLRQGEPDQRVFGSRCFRVPALRAGRERFKRLHPGSKRATRRVRAISPRASHRLVSYGNFRRPT